MAAKLPHRGRVAAPSAKPPQSLAAGTDQRSDPRLCLALALAAPLLTFRRLPAAARRALAAPTSTSCAACLRPAAQHHLRPWTTRTMPTTLQKGPHRRRLFRQTRTCPTLATLLPRTGRQSCRPAGRWRCRRSASAAFTCARPSTTASRSTLMPGTTRSPGQVHGGSLVA
jgi:hypothetical protein